MWDDLRLLSPPITESLNADLVKTDNPDAVVATEPQGNHP